MPLTKSSCRKPARRWKKARSSPGRSNRASGIKTGEILLDIETDKAVMDVESPATGVLLRSLFAADEKVPATHLIAVIGEGIESAEEIDRFIKGITRPGSAPDTPSAAAPEPAAAARRRKRTPKEPTRE